MESQLWILQPILFILAVYNLDKIKKYFPDVFFGLWQNNKSPINPLEKHPLIKMHTRETLLSAINELDPTGEKYKEIRDQLSSMPKDVFFGVIYEKGTDRPFCIVKSKTTGFLNFVNLLWIASIIGVAVFFIPFILIVLEPIINHFSGFFLEILTFIYPIFEPLFYTVALVFIIQGLRYDQSAGYYISLTGCFIFVTAVVYSRANHCTSDKNIPCDVQTTHSFIILAWMPIAVFYQSRLMGFIAVYSLFTMLGFGVVCGGLCWIIGFDSEDAMVRCWMASLIILILTMIVKININKENGKLIAPFETGLIVCGSIVYYLAMIIMCSSLYDHSRKTFTYAGAQFVMICSLLGGTASGSVFHADSMTNTSITFAIIYATEKIFENFLTNNLTVFFFLWSLLGYYISMYLKTHPKFLTNMFKV